MRAGAPGGLGVHLLSPPSPRCPHHRDRHPGVLLALLEVVNVTGFFFHQEFKTQNKTSAVKLINLKERK